MSARIPKGDLTTLRLYLNHIHQAKLELFSAVYAVYDEYDLDFCKQELKYYYV